jgi:transcriptional regulator with XRE-family HTH domain
MSKDMIEKGERRGRNATKPLATTERRPLPGARFPSVVFGENVRKIRNQIGLNQGGLADLMNQMGFDGWKYVTVSHVERGLRTTGIDELFAVAVVLNTTIATLLDPNFAGDQGPGSGNQGPAVDLGVPWPDDLLTAFARTFILVEDAPWQRERWPGVPHTEYRKQFAKVEAARKERDERERENSGREKGNTGNT